MIGISTPETLNTEVPIQSVTFDVRRTDRRIGISLERPIYFECNYNEPMHIGMQSYASAARLAARVFNEQQVRCIFSFSLRSRTVLFLFSASKCLLEDESSFLVELLSFFSSAGEQHSSGVEVLSLFSVFCFVCHYRANSCFDSVKRLFSRPVRCASSAESRFYGW